MRLLPVFTRVSFADGTKAVVGRRHDFVSSKAVGSGSNSRFILNSART